eukprot:symbB.v1.2.028080.t1/scaffold2830.1/size69359/2
MHSCCHIFCELCWKECQKRDARCPMCRDMEEPAVPAYRCRKDIEKLQIRCPRGCGATFPLLQKDRLLQHLECSFQQADGCNGELQDTQEIRQEVFFESKGNLSTLKQFIRQHVDRIREGRFTVKDFIFHHEVRAPDEYKGQGPLAAQAVRRSGLTWPSPGERFSFVVAQGSLGNYINQPGCDRKRITFRLDGKRCQNLSGKNRLCHLESP